LHYYREVTYINPYETSAYEGMASIYLRQGQYDRALAAAEDMTQLEPDEAKSWNYLAMVAYRAGRAQEDLRLLRSAREAAERAEEIHPDGRATQILQHIDAAIDALENAPQ
jgi:DNA-binding SARP family transcriptional activator